MEDPVVVVAGLRTPFVKHNARLGGLHAVDLSARLLRVIPTLIGEIPSDAAVIGACATNVGEQALNVARSASLSAEWPESIPAWTLDAQQVSGMIAVHEAVSVVASQRASIAVALGVEVTSRVPPGASTGMAVGKPYGPGVHARYMDEGGLRAPHAVAEAMARSRKINRADADAYAQTSVGRASAATPNDIVAVDGVVDDEIVNVRTDATVLHPQFEAEGMLTAMTVAPQADGVAAVVVMRRSRASMLGLAELATVAACKVRGSSALEGDSGYGVAFSAVESSGVELGEIDRLEVHEDTAITPLAFALDSEISIERINPEGGALGIGDPLGASGVRAVSAVVHGLCAGGGQWGLAVVAGYAPANAAILLQR